MDDVKCGTYDLLPGTIAPGIETRGITSWHGCEGSENPRGVLKKMTLGVSEVDEGGVGGGRHLGRWLRGGLQGC